MAMLAPLPVFMRIGDGGAEMKIGTITPEVTLREPAGDGTVIADVHVPVVEFFRESGGRIGLRKVPRKVLQTPPGPPTSWSRHGQAYVKAGKAPAPESLSAIGCGW